MTTVKVKICGIRTVEHAVAAAEAGADFVGFVFAESRRRITPVEAATIARALPSHVARVGLFVNEAVETIRDVVATVGLDYVQLCGDEPPELCAALPTPVIKTFHVAGREALAKLPAYDGKVALYLLDGFQAGRYGGTGQTFDWAIAREAAQERPVMVAGGLNPENVAQAIAQARPWGVDVSSGVETDGVKDVVKIAAFVAAAKRATRR